MSKKIRHTTAVLQCCYRALVGALERSLAAAEPGGWRLEMTHSFIKGTCSGFIHSSMSDLANTLFPPPPDNYGDAQQRPRADWVAEEGRWLCFGEEQNVYTRIKGR